MKENILYKIVYKDDTNQVVKGYILEDEPYTIKIKTEDGAVIMIGKANIVKVVPVAIVR